VALLPVSQHSSEGAFAVQPACRASGPEAFSMASLGFLRWMSSYPPHVVSIVVGAEEEEERKGVGQGSLASCLSVSKSLPFAPQDCCHLKLGRLRCSPGDSVPFSVSYDDARKPC